MYKSLKTKIKSRQFAVIRHRYSLLEILTRRVHNVIAAAMSISVAFGNKVMDTHLPLPEGSGDKYDVDSNVQCGRSMIEMLGVLAIIGVLSVGGIAGYSKAMEKFKINKALQQITMIANNIRTLFANEKNFDNLYVYDWETKEHAETMLSLGIITADMYTENSVNGNIGESYIVNPFNGGIWVSSHGNYTYQDHYIPSYFRISYGMVNKAICMELATKNWNELGVHTLVISDNDEDYFSPEMKNEIYKDIDCISDWCSINFWANYTFFPLSPSLVSDACSACDKNKYGCGFQLYFVN